MISAALNPQWIRCDNMSRGEYMRFTHFQQPLMIFPQYSGVFKLADGKSGRGSVPDWPRALYYFSIRADYTFQGWFRLAGNIISNAVGDRRSPGRLGLDVDCYWVFMNVEGKKWQYLARCQESSASVRLLTTSPRCVRLSFTVINK